MRTPINATTAELDRLARQTEGPAQTATTAAFVYYACETELAKRDVRHAQDAPTFRQNGETVSVTSIMDSIFGS